MYYRQEWYSGIKNGLMNIQKINQNKKGVYAFLFTTDYVDLVAAFCALLSNAQKPYYSPNLVVGRLLLLTLLFLMRGSYSAYLVQALLRFLQKELCPLQNILRYHFRPRKLREFEILTITFFICSYPMLGVR